MRLGNVHILLIALPLHLSLLIFFPFCLVLCLSKLIMRMIKLECITYVSNFFHKDIIKEHVNAFFKNLFFFIMLMEFP